MACMGCLVPATMLELAGVTAMETSLAPLTVRLVEPCTPLRAACTCVAPIFVPVAVPLDPAALLIVAIVPSTTDQVTVVVMSTTEPSE